MTTLGVRLRDSQLSITAMRELAQLAERKGYESVWLPEAPGRVILGLGIGHKPAMEGG